MKVLVTRLKKDCEATADKLVQLGFEAVALPLTELVFLQASVKTADPDFALFTSANAVDAIPEKTASKLKTLPAYAVGPKTADALIKKTYKNIRQGEGSAQALADLILHEHRGKHFSGVYFCGEERSFDFEKVFLSHGSVELCEVYRIAELGQVAGDIGEKFEAVRGGVMLVYSSLGAERLIKAFELAGKSKLMNQITVIAISANAAKPFQAVAVNGISIASEPTESAMLDALQQYRA